MLGWYFNWVCKNEKIEVEAYLHEISSFDNIDRWPGMRVYGPFGDSTCSKEDMIKVFKLWNSLRPKHIYNYKPVAIDSLLTSTFTSYMM